MIKKMTVSTILSEVRANASFSTRKASTVTMEIDKRFSLEAYGLYLDRLDNIENKLGLIGFELVAVYEDGQPEPVKIESVIVGGEEFPIDENANIEESLEKITKTLNEATAEETSRACNKVVNEETGYNKTTDDPPVYLCLSCYENSENSEQQELELTEKEEGDKDEQD